MLATANHPAIPFPLAKQLVGSAIGLLPHFTNPEVTDIFVNGLQSAFTESCGELEEVENPFKDNVSLMDFIERLLAPLGKRVDAQRPYVDGRLLDGSRFHVILPPLSVVGPTISIRKLRPESPIRIENFLREPSLIQWVKDQVAQRKNLLVCGSTGSGKTTLLRSMIELVPPNERILIIEETQELCPNHPHALSLESRPPSPEGMGEVTVRQLVKNTLRMRPDRIMIGECRGEEAFELVQAMNTGHRGSFCTLHANGPRDALRRLEGLVLMAGFQIPIGTVREWIAHSVHAVIFVERHENVRQIGQIAVVQGIEGDVYRLRPVK